MPRVKLVESWSVWIRWMTESRRSRKMCWSVALMIKIWSVWIWISAYWRSWFRKGSRNISILRRASWMDSGKASVQMYGLHSAQVYLYLLRFFLEWLCSAGRSWSVSQNLSADYPLLPNWREVVILMSGPRRTAATNWLCSMPVLIRW